MTSREKIDYCILSLLDHKHSTAAEISDAVQQLGEDFPHPVELVLRWLCQDGLCYQLNEVEIDCGPRYALTYDGQQRFLALTSKASQEAMDQLARGSILEAQRELLGERGAKPAGDDLGGCMLPPHGWECTRQAGHEGPCAAKPTRSLAEAAAEFVATHFPEATEATICNAQEPPAGDFDEDDDESHTTLCLTERAIDAWWDSLPIETKAEVMTNHYEAAAAFSDRVLLTEAGAAAAANCEVPA